jgi:peptidyl-prolyl isomerase E (cyclophilin E)
MSELLNNEDRTNRTVWISGLDELATPDLIKSACIPFGDLVDVSLPLDNKTGKHRGFAFIEFESGSDAKECVDNLNGAEILGKTIIARISKRTVTDAKGGAIWNAELWVNELASVGGEEMDDSVNNAESVDQKRD